jgi:Helix-turn-helix domain
MTFQLVNVVMLPDGRINRKNAAKYLGLAEKTLAMHASRGTGPAFIKRGRVFYFRDDLDEWLMDSPSGKPRPGRGAAEGRGSHPSEPSRQCRRAARR